MTCSNTCKTTKEKVSFVDLSINEWESFKNSSFWNAVLFEIEERDKVLMDLLRYGDPDKKWTDREIRSRINELEYLKTLPEMILMDLKLSEEREEEKGEEEL